MEREQKDIVNLTASPSNLPFHLTLHSADLDSALSPQSGKRLPGPLVSRSISRGLNTPAPSEKFLFSFRLQRFLRFIRKDSASLASRNGGLDNYPLFCSPAPPAWPIKPQSPPKQWICQRERVCRSCYRLCITILSLSVNVFGYNNVIDVRELRV